MFFLTFIPGGKIGIDCIKRTISSPFTKLFINKAKAELSEQQIFRIKYKLYNKNIYFIFLKKIIYKK